MTENFFSKQGKCYSTVRPDYPNQLIHYLSSLCNIKQSVWDCATGNGQVAKKLVHQPSNNDKISELITKEEINDGPAQIQDQPNRLRDTTTKTIDT